jgi:dienelactone hydrolase
MRPAFDHLGGLAEQLDTAVAGRCTMVYATGIGRYSYNGLPPKAEMDAYVARLQEYNRKGHAGGVGLMLSYLCATSIVNVGTFAANWHDYFPDRPAAFAPRRMLQQDIHGDNLASWYGGAYAPADMWNPYWRRYTRLTIKLAVEAGHDGVFFDNPTVHPTGNYSPYAMRAWERFLKREGVDTGKEKPGSPRALTQSQPERWRRFRVTEAADFLREMRDYGRSLKRSFVLTANNSLNSWDSFYSQPRGYGYSIPEQSRNEALITIEDMSSQPRRMGDSYVSYAGTLRLLPAISSGRPLSICTTAGDYTTPPNLMRLAIAECTAHDTSYMVWSCWEPAFRAANAAAVARYHDFLEAHTALFGSSRPVADLLLVWPYENWLRRGDCPTAYLARALSARNVQYDVVTEADLTRERLRAYPAVVCAAAEELVRPATAERLRAYEQHGGIVTRAGPVETGAGSSRSRGLGMSVDLDGLGKALGLASVTVEGASGIRAVVRRSKAGDCLLHLYNLNVARDDSYHDRVIPVENVRVSWLLPRGVAGVPRVRLLTPDEAGAEGWVPCEATRVGERTMLEFAVPKLWIWTVVTLAEGASRRPVEAGTPPPHQRELSLPSTHAMGQTPPFYTDKFDLLTYLDAAGAKHPIRTGEAWSKRRAHIFAGMQRVMGALPGEEKRVPLALEVLETATLAGVTRKKITYVAEPGDRVPAYLLIPNALKGRAPAVLCLHQTVAEGKAEPAGLAGRSNLHYALELAERGYVTLAPDFPGFGENKSDPYALGYASATMKGIWNHIRAVDLLASLPEVDGERIGCIGHSLGGHNTLWATAFDPRIKVAVTSCGFDSFLDYMGGDLSGWSGARAYMPRIAADYGKDPRRMPFDFPEVLAAIAPRPVFINAPLRDSNFRAESVRKCVAAAASVYRLLGAEKNLVASYPDCEHDFPAAVRQAAYAFIDKALGKTDSR